MDNLTKDAVAATKAGMTYGKYMAMKEPVEITPPERRGTWRTCQWCGKEFVRYDKMRQKYCTVLCQRAAQDAREYERKHGKPKEEIVLPEAEPEEIPEKVCDICGKHFRATDWRRKYCSDKCRAVGASERAKKHQARKAKEER